MTTTSAAAPRDRAAAAPAVAHRIVDTPVGAVLLAATERGLLQVAFARQDHDTVLARLAGGHGGAAEARGRLDAASRQVEEYFDGRRTRFELALDWRLPEGFRHQVLHHLPSIPYGRTASYGDVAAAVGSPRAVRAVGTACGRNPLPIVVPCHRVVRADGSSGGFVGGPEAKETLLDLERRHAAP